MFSDDLFAAVGCWLILIGGEFALDFWQGGAGGFLTQLDGALFLVETADRTHIQHLRFDYDVCLTQFMLEQRNAHDVERLVEIREKAFVDVFHRTGGNIDGDNEIGTLFFSRADGNGLRQTTIHISAAANHGGLEHVGNGSGRADCLSDVAPIEGDGFAAFKIGGDGGEFDRKLLDGAVADFVVDVVLQFFAFDEAAAGEGQVNQVGFAQNLGFEFEAVGRHA